MASGPLGAIPPALKKVTPFMKRAEELDKDTVHPESKAVAYYCRAYAMDQAMLLRDASNQKEVMPFLLALMDRLEADKKANPQLGKAGSGGEGRALVQAFADRVFTKADEEDQIGASDKNTARTFYAAGVFYDVMQQFKAVPGEGSEAEQEAERELERRRKYCKWKAAEILNAIKEGRSPAPGGYGSSAIAAEGAGGEETATAATDPPAMAEGKPPAAAGGAAAAPASPPRAPSSPPPPPYTAPAPTTKPSSPPPPPPPAYQAPPPTTATTTTKPAPTSKPASAMGGSKQAALDDAKELCYFAIAAIQHKEPALAIERLEQALGRLKGL